MRTEKILIGKENIVAIIERDGKKKIIRDKKAARFNILAIVKDASGRIKSIVKGINIVTNDGDTFYAQKAAGETPTYTFVNCVLGTGTVAAAKTNTYDNMTPIAGSNKAPSTGYPKTNDTDANNTGKGVDIITWKYEWGAADFANAAISEGCITIASPVAGSKVLTRFLFSAAFEKTTSDTLKLYVNHEMLGV